MPQNWSRVTLACIRHPLVVVLIALLLAAASLLFTVRSFSINTDTARLISPDTPWRKTESAFDTAFPGRRDLIVAVIDAPTPERADAAAAALAEKLKGEPAIRSVRQPDAGAFFDRNGLLLLKPEEFPKTLEDIVRQQPLLAVLAADPGLGGVLSSLQLSAQGVKAGQLKLGDMTRAMEIIASAIEKSGAGPVEPVSWRSLVAQEDPGRRDLRRFVLIQPVLDFNALEPGAEGISAVRRVAGEIGIGPGTDTAMRLTGQVPLADEEFSTVAEGALFNTVGTIAVVLGLLFAALGSARLVIAVMATLLMGLVTTAGLGLAVVGEYNLISVAFAVLFVGLGVDFSIQLAVRYRDTRHELGDLLNAVGTATDAMRRPLLVAACSTAIGFLAFIPTPYTGVSELGLIAGLGMLIALLASLTLLPALLVLLRPPPEPAPVGYKSLANADRFIERHRRAILIVTGVLFLAGMPLLAKLRFDSNPMNLRSSAAESVATFYDLASDLDTTPQTLDLIVADTKAAAALTVKLKALPEVHDVISVSTFLPDDQEARIAAISDASLVMDTVLEPIAVKPPRDQAALRDDILATQKEFEGLLANAPDDKSRVLITRMADALGSLAAMPPDRYKRVEQAIGTNIAPLLDKVRAVFNPEAITLESLPPDLRADWVTANGLPRLEIRPSGNMSNPDELRRFVDAVRAVAPDVTGVPVTIVESGRTVVNSFLIAAVIALVSITLLLFFLLESWRDVLVTLVPLVVAILMSLQVAVLIDLPLNFANIIALPLMCGVSVAFHIYFVLAWRRGEADVLASSLTRAILFSALTTASAFGSLCLSSHPGTASMGKLLTLSLSFTLLAAFVFVPAFLGPPPVQPSAKSE